MAKTKAIALDPSEPWVQVKTELEAKGESHVRRYYELIAEMRSLVPAGHYAEAQATRLADLAYREWLDRFRAGIPVEPEPAFA